MKVKNCCSSCMQTLPPPSDRIVKSIEDGCRVWVCPSCGADVGTYEKPIWCRPINESLEDSLKKRDEFNRERELERSRRP